MTINYWGVLAQTVAAWFFGAAYYGTLGGMDGCALAAARSRSRRGARRRPCRSFR